MDMHEYVELDQLEASVTVPIPTVLVFIVVIFIVLSLSNHVALQRSWVGV